VIGEGILLERKSGNMVPGAFALVLVLELVSAIRPCHLTDIPSVVPPLNLALLKNQCGNGVLDYHSVAARFRFLHSEFANRE
jgi:hypothetical protein